MLAAEKNTNARFKKGEQTDPHDTITILSRNFIFNRTIVTRTVALMQPVTRIRLLGIRLGMILLAGYWLSIFVGTHLPKLPPIARQLHDKSMHTSAFFGLAILLCYCTNSARVWLRFPAIVAVCLAYAIFDELTQSFVRGRQADVMDFLADAVGTLVAVIGYATLRGWMMRRQKQGTSKATVTVHESVQ